MFIDNNWYGNKYIFSRYCKISEKKIFGSLQHGLFMVYHFKKSNKNKKKIGERSFKTIPWFVWNNFIEDASVKDKSNNVVSIGSPFLYLDKILSKNVFPINKEVLVIPPKSAQEIDHNIDYQRIIDFLMKKKFKKPYKILVGQSDLEKIKKLNKNFDCKFVSCGDRNSKYFTFKLYKYIKEASAVVALYPGSPILYSVFLKKKTFYFKKRFLKYSQRKIFKNKKLNKSEKYDLKQNNLILKLSWFNKYDQYAIESFKKEYNINIFKLNNKNTYKKVLVALGSNNIKSASEIKRIFGWNNIFKMLMASLLTIFMKIRYGDLK